MKPCPRCGAMKFNFHSNGYCSDCENKRHREIWLRRKAEKEEAGSYLDRHLQRRAEEASYQHGVSPEQPSPIRQRGVCGLKPDLNLAQIASQIMVGSRPLKFKRAWEVV